MLRLMVFGFEGTEAPPELLAYIRRGLGGVILFSRNIRDPLQVASLIQTLQAEAEVPLLVGIDQEGGSVSRLPAPFTVLAGNRALGRCGDPAVAYAVGRAVAAELAAVGFNLNFAPVLDVETRPDNPVIGPRSLGSDPNSVAELGCALIRGMQEERVIACGKHFPGHGHTRLDSHHALPEVDRTVEELRRVELLPFARAVTAGVEAMMTAHVRYPALDPDLPATLSPAIVQGILRRELGFEGLLFSDDLEMKAVAEPWGVGTTAAAAIRAGVDMLLVCRDPALQEEAVRGVTLATERGEIPRSRLEEAAARIRDLKRRRLNRLRPPDPERIRSVVAAASHRELAQRLERWAG